MKKRHTRQQQRCIGSDNIIGELTGSVRIRSSGLGCVGTRGCRLTYHDTLTDTQRRHTGGDRLTSTCRQRLAASALQHTISSSQNMSYASSPANDDNDDDDDDNDTE